MIKSPTTNAGSGLSAIRPVEGGHVDSPFTVSSAAVVSTNVMDTGAVYIYSSTPVHMRLSLAGDNATTSDTPIPAGVPLVFHCEDGDKISFIKMAGVADGTVWVIQAAKVG